MATPEYKGEEFEFPDEKEAREAKEAVNQQAAAE